MLERTTWNKVMDCDQVAVHGATSVELEPHQISGVGKMGINSVTVSKESNGYEISLEVCFDLCSGLTKEQVIAKLRELQALDGDWE